MKLLITIEIDVHPNDDIENLEKEVKDCKKSLKDYFENHDDHWLFGLLWTGQKVKSITKSI